MVALLAEEERRDFGIDEQEEEFLQMIRAFLKHFGVCRR